MNEEDYHEDDDEEPFCLSAFLSAASASLFLSVSLWSVYNLSIISMKSVQTEFHNERGNSVDKKSSGQEIEQSFLSPTPAENQAYAIAPSEKLIESAGRKERRTEPKKH